MLISEFMQLTEEDREARLIARHRRIDTLHQAQDAERLAHAAQLTRNAVPEATEAVVIVGTDEMDGSVWWASFQSMRDETGRQIWHVDSGDEDDLTPATDWIAGTAGRRAVPRDGCYHLDLLTGAISFLRD